MIRPRTAPVSHPSPDPAVGGAPRTTGTLGGRRLLLQGLAAAGLAGSLTARPLEASAPSEPPPGAVRVAFIGDIPYSAWEEQRLLALFDAFAGQVDFALHVGDLKASRESCSDILLERRIALLDRSPVPLLFTPGDNDWLDCWRERAGGFDPVERLQWIRQRIFLQPKRSLGGTPEALERLGPIEQQSQLDGGPPENLRWQAGGACWITLNLPGSNNGLSASIEDEHRIERDRANRRWLEAGVARARATGARALVIALQANPRFERAAASEGAGRVDPSGSEDGYAAFRADLFRIQADWGRPVMLLHGDTHRFRHDWLRRDLLRVECFGSPFAQSWVKIVVDPAATPPFRVTVEHL